MMSQLRRTVAVFAAVTSLLVGLSAAARGQTTATIYVDNANPSASDTNAGTSALPFRTIQRAVDMADANQLAGTGTTILVGPGVYRESVKFATARSQTAPIVLRGAPNGGTVVSGSDVWPRGWLDQGGGVYRHSWLDTWGPAPAPAVWNAPEIVRRREMVFANGVILRQYLTAQELAAAPSGFRVEEASQGLFVKLPGGSDPSASIMEVGRRDRILYAEGRHNITVQQMTFQHAVSPVQGHAVSFPGSTDIVLEDVRAVWNNWGGINFYGFEAPTPPVARVTMRRVDASDNGSFGVGGYRTDGLQLLDSATNRNAWRMAWGNQWYTEDGGVRLMRSSNWLIDGHRAEGNLGMGIWHDSSGVNGTVRNTVARDNGTYGVFFEANPGPMRLENSKVCGNGNIGVAVSQSEGTTLTGNQVFGNRSGNGQVTFTGQEGGRYVDGVFLHNRGITMTGNTVVGDSTGVNVIENTLDSPGWTAFATTLTARDNRYWSSARPEAFNWWKTGTSWRGNYDFASWQAATGQDQTSVFSPPSTVLVCDLQLPIPVAVTSTTTTTPRAPTTTVAPTATTAAPTTSTPAPTSTTLKVKGKKR